MLDEMLSCTFVGTADQVHHDLQRFVAATGADELMVACQIFDHAARLGSYELLASTWNA